MECKGKVVCAHEDIAPPILNLGRTWMLYRPGKWCLLPIVHKTIEMV